MLSITFVVAVLSVIMTMKSFNVKEQLAECDIELQELETQIADEQERTREIDDLKEYMKTDEYAEEVAREKLGLVKKNEIVLKAQE